MRIIAGKLKGNMLYGPKTKKIRPLKDMVRESIFNLLLHSKKISFPLEKSNILDLYSGTGSFGLECLSRDANKVVFIEKEKEAIETLEKNIEKLKIKHSTKIFFEDVFNIIEKNEANILKFILNFKFDLIFCDPPFKNKNLNDLIKLIEKKKIIKKKWNYNSS
tara:strand:- start:225 stop:713 length:489 start_codon:yes stop_codon:yes gene_type:complete